MGKSLRFVEIQSRKRCGDCHISRLWPLGIKLDWPTSPRYLQLQPIWWAQWTRIMGMQQPYNGEQRLPMPLEHNHLLWRRFPPKRFPDPFQILLWPKKTATSPTYSAIEDDCAATGHLHTWTLASELRSEIPTYRYHLQHRLIPKPPRITLQVCNDSSNLFPPLNPICMIYKIPFPSFSLLSNRQRAPLLCIECEFF